MGLTMVNQIDLFNTESPEKSGIQTLGFHYQIEKNLLIVTDLKSQKKHKYVMRGFIYADIKSNLIARFKKVLADRKTLPGAFFKSFMSVEIIKSELKTFENL
jgi:hypothetical protein